MVISQKFLNKEYGPIKFQVGFEKLREFLIATKADLEKFSEFVSPTFPVVYQNVLLADVLFDKELKLNLRKLVHGEQEFNYLKPVKVGDTIETKGKISKIFSKGKHDFVVFHTESFNQLQEKVCDSFWTFIVRGGNDTDFTLSEKLAMKFASLLPEKAQEKAQKKLLLKELEIINEKTIDLEKPFQDLFYLEKFNNKEVVYKIFVDKYLPQVYAGASGDFNVIHLDKDFAKKVGLGTNILHGMATMALGVNMIAAEINPAKLKSYKVRFTGVVKPCDVLTYKGKWQSDEQFVFNAKNQAGQEVLTAAEILFN